MARAAYITTDIWIDDGFREMSKDEKLVWMYLITSPLSNIAGFFKLPPTYIEVAIDKESANILQSPCKMWKYDADTKQVLLTNFLKHNTPKSSSQMKAVAKQVQSLDRCGLLVDFMFSVYKYCSPEIFEYFDKRFMDYIRTEAKLRNDRVGTIVSNIDI